MLYSQMKRVIPICFLVGASMEMFMIQTGFYEIVTRKEGERQALRLIEHEARKKKLEDMGIKFD